MNEAAEEIERIVRINGNIYPPEQGVTEYHFPPDIILRFKETAHTLFRAAEMLRRVDYLVCSDDGEESFRTRWEEEVRKPYLDSAP